MRLPGSDVGMQEDLVGVGLPEEQFSGGLVEAGHGGREAEEGCPSVGLRRDFPAPFPICYQYCSSPASKWASGEDLLCSSVSLKCRGMKAFCRTGGARFQLITDLSPRAVWAKIILFCSP